jgi:flagellar protein FliJ
MQRSRCQPARRSRLASGPAAKCKRYLFQALRIVDLAKFVFSLETLLQHRERIEQRERDELFRLNYKYQIELRNREDLINNLKKTMEDLSGKQAENPVSQELSWFCLYINRLGHEIKKSEERLSKLELEIQKQKESVIEASKKKKVLVSLKAKKEKEFFVALEKQEQKEIDELVATRYVDKGPKRPASKSKERELRPA